MSAVAMLWQAAMADPSCSHLRAVVEEKEGSLKEYLASKRDRQHLMAGLDKELTGEVTWKQLSALTKARKSKTMGARALEGLEGAVEVVVEAVEGVGVVVGVVLGVATAAAAIEAAKAVELAEGAEAAKVVEEAEAEEAAEAAEAAAAEASVVERVATLRRGVALVVVSASSSSGVV
ncbi:unnamed protein product [Closterium sp. NIES-64]|nr:unnamed protein product [Closterium sp. NIES-64]